MSETSPSRSSAIRPQDRSTDEAPSVFAPDISVLIVGYNSAELISACIDSIETAARRHTCEILLTDNGDGSTEAVVAGKFPNVRIIPTQGNIGFAAGNNLLADSANAPLLLLLNPDMIALPGSIDALVEASRNYPEAVAWGGVTVDEAGKPDTGNAIAMPSLGEFLSVALGRSRIGSGPVAGLDRDACVDVLVGGFVMFSRKAWDEVGGLDERYFLYCEEVDLFYRLQLRGYEAWRISSAMGAHKAAHGNTLSPMRLLYRAAGTMEFVRAHWNFAWQITAGALVWIAAVERLIAGRLFGHWRPHLRQLGHGYRLVALRPDYWIFGYDRRRGLMAKLERSPLNI